MSSYEENAIRELRAWQGKMSKKPSITSRIAKGIQNRVNNMIPNRVHKLITTTIKSMVKAVLFGSGLIAGIPLVNADLENRERSVREKLNFYKKTAALSGAGTGAGGFFLGLADLPVLISLKIKFLFDVAGLYGFNVSDYRERLYILYIFQLAFSSEQRSKEIYRQMADWDNYVTGLPKDMDSFDWKTFQQEYRDYIDLAKMLQLVPGVGAVVGAYANYRLMDKLGETAVYSYRMRLFA